MSDLPIKVIRSHKRHKTISAKMIEGTMHVYAPAGMSEAELQPIIANLQERLMRRLAPTPQTDDELQSRAQALNKTYFDGRLRWESIEYVTNQNTRYGSCTPATGRIRLNHRLAALPTFVRDYVLMHELAHLVHPNHGIDFWALVYRYPFTERARGYLMALSLEQLPEEEE